MRQACSDGYVSSYVKWVIVTDVPNESNQTLTKRQLKKAHHPSEDSDGCAPLTDIANQKHDSPLVNPISTSTIQSHAETDEDIAIT